MRINCIVEWKTRSEDAETVPRQIRVERSPVRAVRTA